MSDHLVRDILTSRDKKDRDNQETVLDLQDFVDNLKSQIMEIRYLRKYRNFHKHEFIFFYKLSN